MGVAESVKHYLQRFCFCSLVSVQKAGILSFSEVSFSID